VQLVEYLKPLSTTLRHALAADCGTSYLHLRNIAFSGKSCGIQLAVDLERVTRKAVCRWDLRPDDWHRIWPELVGTEGAPAVPAAHEVAA